MRMCMLREITDSQAAVRDISPYFKVQKQNGVNA